MPLKLASTIFWNKNESLDFVDTQKSYLKTIPSKKV
jgi:hypothetical protein